MSGKAFFFLVLAALALGVVAGGALIAVLASDDSGAQDTFDYVAIPGPGNAGGGPQGAAPSESDLQALAQRVRSGEIDPQEMAALRQRLQGQAGGIGGDPPAEMAALCERPASAAAWWESSTHWRMAPLW